METTVHGFVIDSLFFNKQDIDLTGSVDTGIGYLNDKLINYFYTLAKINDKRTSRLPLLSQPIPKGYLSIQFDNSKQTDLNVIKSFTKANQAIVFNILETCYLSQNKIDTDLNTEFIQDSNYGIYEPNSIKLSSAKVSTTIKIDTTDITLDVPEWVEFTVNVNSNKIKFHLWLVSASFAKNYPLSTITKVIAPCDPVKLLDPSKFANIIDSIVQSNMFSFAKINEDMLVRDHTGMLTFKVKYITGSSTAYDMPFGILYKGARPSTLEIRKSIREYLIGLGIAPENNWKLIFPDLFITGQFFIYPKWDNITVRVDRTIFPSVINYMSLIEMIKRINPNQDVVYIEKHTEVIMNGYKEFFSCIIADPLNDTHFSFLKLHPTYVYYQAQLPGYQYQEALTKEFNVRFNRCISVLIGEATNTGEFSINNFDERDYLSFVVDGIEYHVLTKEGFLV